MADLASKTHACPGGCGQQIAPDRLACRADWWRLPANLRRWVGASWRERARFPQRHRVAVVAALAWFKEQQARVEGE